MTVNDQNYRCLLKALEQIPNQQHKSHVNSKFPHMDQYILSSIKYLTSHMSYTSRANLQTNIVLEGSRHTCQKDQV